MFFPGTQRWVKKQCCVLSREWGGEHALDGLLVGVLLQLSLLLVGLAVQAVITFDKCFLDAFSGCMTELHHVLIPEECLDFWLRVFSPVGTSAIYPRRACPIVAVVCSTQRQKGEAESPWCISNHSIFNGEDLLYAFSLD